MDDAQILLIRNHAKENSIDDKGETRTKTYDLIPRVGKENLASSAGGLALNQPQKPSLGRKTLLSKAQMKETKEILEGKQNMINRVLRARKSPGRVTLCCFFL